METIKIGIGVSSIGRFLPVLGRAAGLFENAGIAAEVVNRQDEEKIVEDIVSGETPIGTPNAPSLVFSRLSGNDLVIFGGVLNRPAFYLAANAKLGGIDDLRGKKVGINQPRRMAGMVMLALLRRWGFDIRRDLTLVDLGLNDRSFEALREGALDAALLPPEKAFLAESEGLHIIADTLDLDCHWVPLATTRTFLAANRALVAKISAVYRDSVHRFKSEPKKTQEEIGRWLPALGKKPQVLKKCYDLFAAEFEPEMAPSLRSIESALREVALQDTRARELRAADLVEELR